MFKLYGVVGEKLTHSFSPQYFKQKFEIQNIQNCQYKTFELKEIAEIRELLQYYPNLQGFNVTIPYKQEIIPFLSHLSEEAEAVGAVNTVKITSEGNNKTLWGYNTDIYGFEKSLTPLLNSRHKKALILGTGGASKAVAFVLNKLGIEFLFVSRQAKDHNVITYDDIDETVVQDFSLVINATPVGMYPNTSMLPLYPCHLAGNKHLFYDLVYNPEKPHFLAEAEKQGATIKNGLEMLHLQADKAWEIWNN